MSFCTTLFGIYKIVFPDGKFYIGSAYGRGGIEHRWHAHQKGGSESPKYLQEMAKSCGGWHKVEFIVLRNTNSRWRTLLWEQAYINRYWGDPLLLNRNPSVFDQPDLSGEANPAKRPEVRNKIRLSKLGDKNPNYGRTFSAEYRKKLGDSHRGKPLSEETKRKISEAHKKRWPAKVSEPKPKKVLKSEANPMFGKHHTEKARRMMSEANKGEHHPNWGKHLTEEVKRKIGQANDGESNGAAKLDWSKVKVLRMLYATGQYSQTYLAERFGVSGGLVCLIVNNHLWKITKERQMKVKELLQILKNLEAASPETLEYEVVMSRDAEGNGYSPLYNTALVRYEEDNSWGGEVSGWDEDVEMNAFCLWPSN